MVGQVCCEVVEKGCRAACRSEQRLVSGDAVVANAQGDEVAQVVRLKVEAVCQCIDLLVVARGDEGRARSNDGDYLMWELACLR